jgi:hypothetical protein
MGTFLMVRPLGVSTEEWPDAVFDPAKPPTGKPGRYPTLVELQQVLESFEGYEVFLFPGGFDYEMVLHHAATSFLPETPRQFSSNSALIHVERAEDEHHPTRFGLPGGNLELSLRILERLSHICGPQLLPSIPDSGEPAILATPGMDIPAVVAKWKAIVDEDLQPWQSRKQAAHDHLMPDDEREQ